MGRIEIILLELLREAEDVVVNESEFEVDVAESLVLRYEVISMILVASSISDPDAVPVIIAEVGVRNGEALSVSLAVIAWSYFSRSPVAVYAMTPKAPTIAAKNATNAETAWKRYRGMSLFLTGGLVVSTGGTSYSLEGGVAFLSSKNAPGVAVYWDVGEPLFIPLAYPGGFPIFSSSSSRSLACLNVVRLRSPLTDLHGGRSRKLDFEALVRSFGSSTVGTVDGWISLSTNV
jgi:hypothetical protein